MHKKLFFIGIVWVTCLHINASENQDKQYTINELFNMNNNKEIKQMVLYKTESNNLLFFLSNNDYSIHSLDLNNHNGKPEYKSCHITDTSINLRWKLGKKKEIYHLAEPYSYKNDIVVPIANKKNVFLAKIVTSNEYSIIELNVFKNIINHNTDIYRLYSCGENIISTSIYPSIKVWQYNQSIASEKELSYTGGLCLGSNSDHNYFYMIKDIHERTFFGKLDRWRNSSNKQINGFLYGFNIEPDDNDEKKEPKFNEIEFKIKNTNLELNLNLTDSKSVLFATYDKNKIANKTIDIDGILLANNNFYLCGETVTKKIPYLKQLKLTDELKSSENIKQMVCFANQKENNNLYLMTLSDKNITVYLLINEKTKGTLLENNIKLDSPIQLKPIKKFTVQNINSKKYQRIAFDKNTNSLYVAFTNKADQTILGVIEKVIA